MVVSKRLSLHALTRKVAQSVLQTSGEIYTFMYDPRGFRQYAPSQTQLDRVSFPGSPNSMMKAFGPNTSSTGRESPLYATDS